MRPPSRDPAAGVVRQKSNLPTPSATDPAVVTAPRRSAARGQVPVQQSGGFFKAVITKAASLRSNQQAQSSHKQMKREVVGMLDVFLDPHKTAPERRAEARNFMARLPASEHAMSGPKVSAEVEALQDSVTVCVREKSAKDLIAISVRVSQALTQASGQAHVRNTDDEVAHYALIVGAIDKELLGRGVESALMYASNKPLSWPEGGAEAAYKAMIQQAGGYIDALMPPLRKAQPGHAGAQRGIVMAGLNALLSKGKISHEQVIEMLGSLDLDEIIAILSRSPSETYASDRVTDYSNRAAQDCAGEFRGRILQSFELNTAHLAKLWYAQVRDIPAFVDRVMDAALQLELYQGLSGALQNAQGDVAHGRADHSMEPALANIRALLDRVFLGGKFPFHAVAQTPGELPEALLDLHDALDILGFEVAQLDGVRNDLAATANRSQVSVQPAMSKENPVPVAAAHEVPVAGQAKVKVAPSRPAPVGPAGEAMGLLASGANFVAALHTLNASFGANAITGDQITTAVKRMKTDERTALAQALNSKDGLMLTFALNEIGASRKFRGKPAGDQMLARGADLKAMQDVVNKLPGKHMVHPDVDLYDAVSTGNVAAILFSAHGVVTRLDHRSNRVDANLTVQAEGRP